MITGLICGAFVKLIKSDDSETTELKEDVLSFSPTVFFCVLLPPIIFCSGYQMKASWFFNNVWKILAFAFIGTFVSSLVIGGFLRLFGMMGASLNLSFAECLAFGALISATDPVTTLAVFEKLRVALLFSQCLLCFSSNSCFAFLAIPCKKASLAIQRV